jgi:hypothetical protein
MKSINDAASRKGVMSSHVVEAMIYEGLVTFVVPRQPQE